MYPVGLKILLGTVVLAVIGPSLSADTFPASGPMVSGKVARLRFGRAAAPLAVKRAIWAANQLRSKPYRYGGGHKSFDDRGYDCSGTVSYALGAAGLISSPMSSIEFRRYGERGRGKWVTIYGARRSHVRCYCRAATRYDAIRSLHRQMGAALANHLSAAARIRSKASHQLVTSLRPWYPPSSADIALPRSRSRAEDNVH